MSSGILDAHPGGSGSRNRFGRRSNVVGALWCPAATTQFHPRKARGQTSPHQEKHSLPANLGRFDGLSMQEPPSADRFQLRSGEFGRVPEPPSVLTEVIPRPGPNPVPIAGRPRSHLVGFLQVAPHLGPPNSGPAGNRFRWAKWVKGVKGLPYRQEVFSRPVAARNCHRDRQGTPLRFGHSPRTSAADWLR